MTGTEAWGHSSIIKNNNNNKPKVNSQIQKCVLYFSFQCLLK